MLLKDIIKEAATLLKLDAVLSLPEMGGNQTDAQAEKELELLKDCVNLVLNEIASDYVPLEFIEEVLVSDRKIPYTALSKTALRVKSVKNGKGRDCYFKVYPSYIYTDCDGVCRIEYCYIPVSAQNLDDTLEYNQRVTSRLIAYGTAREYCLIMSMYEEALSFDGRFKDSLQNAVRQNTVLKIPKRLWR